MGWPKGGEFGAKSGGGGSRGRGECTNQHINCLWCAGEERWEQRLEAAAHLVTDNRTFMDGFCHHDSCSTDDVRAWGNH
jgi:hypothetical protein